MTTDISRHWPVDAGNTWLWPYHRCIYEWAAKDGETLVVVTADHETGGLTLVDGDLAEGRIVCVSTGGHSGVTVVPVYALVPGAEEFMGFLKILLSFDKIKTAQFCNLKITISMLKHILLVGLLFPPPFAESSELWQWWKVSFAYKNTYVGTAGHWKWYRVAKPETIVPKSLEEARHSSQSHLGWHDKNLKCIEGMGNSHRHIPALKQARFCPSSHLDSWPYNGNIFMWDSFILMFARFGTRFFPSRIRWTTLRQAASRRFIICRKPKAMLGRLFRKRYDPCEYRTEFDALGRLHQFAMIRNACTRYLYFVLIISGWNWTILGEMNLLVKRDGDRHGYMPRVPCRNTVLSTVTGIWFG